MKPEFNEYHNRDGDHAHAGSRAVSWVVLGLAASGFIALAWYAYQSGSESISAGDVPVIEADGSPVKVPPENPGGESFPHQDKTIYNTISGDTETPGEEKLLPEPETPVIAASEDDASESGTRTWVREHKEETPDADELEPKKLADVAPAQAPEEKKPEAPVAKEIPKLTQAPVLKKEIPVTPKEIPVVKVEPEVIAPSPALVPPAEPVVAPKPVEAAKPVEIKPVETPKPAPAVAATGDYKIQLGAYKSQAEADSNWARISRKYVSALDGKSHIVVKADLPNGTYYRLRASGYASPEAAKQACSALSAQGQACFYAGK